MRTIAELEVLHFLKKISDDDASVLVIDSRTPAWVEKGMIPGTVNIPWDTLEIGKSNPAAVQTLLQNQLGAERRDGFWNFDKAKTLVLFCNGSWCGQSPTTIKGLLGIGYPAHKLLWYRGGCWMGSGSRQRVDHPCRRGAHDREVRHRRPQSRFNSGNLDHQNKHTHAGTAPQDGYLLARRKNGHQLAMR